MHRLPPVWMLAVSAAFASFCAPVRADQPSALAVTFSDAICPSASAPVRRLYALGADPQTTAAAFIAQVRSVIGIYDRCREQKFVDGAVRDYQYAETRLAQFQFQAGHMERLIDQAADAKRSLTSGLALANDVVKWTPSPSGDATGDRSAYYDSAVAIRDAIAKELALLPPS